MLLFVTAGQFNEVVKLNTFTTGYSLLNLIFQNIFWEIPKLYERKFGQMQKP